MRIIIFGDILFIYFLIIISLLFCSSFFFFFLQIFNIFAIIFAQSAENPYYAVKSVIKFDSIVIAGACFSAITLAVVLIIDALRDSLKWLRNELLIQCVLIIVYIYGCVTMVPETLNCYRTLDNGCPRQLTATVRIYFYFIFGLCYWFFWLFVFLLFYFCAHHHRHINTAHTYIIYLLLLLQLFLRIMYYCNLFRFAAFREKRKNSFFRFALKCLGHN